MDIILKPCPFCGKMIDEQNELYLPERDWKPSFYDPDSGGDPISIVCKCGLEFSTGTYEWEEFIKAWNTRQYSGIEKVDIDTTEHDNEVRAEVLDELKGKIDYRYFDGYDYSDYEEVEMIVRMIDELKEQNNGR